MADDKSGRDKQARDEEQRQRRRAMEEELERWGETEPEVDESALGDVEATLESLEYPATAAEVVDVAGDHEVESADGTYTVEELLPETDAVEFDSPADVRVRVERPTVAASMKRIVEANRELNRDRLGSQRNAYEKTLLALKNVTADDDDEGIAFITDWIVGQIHEGKHPGSRDVRRRAAKWVREQGYEVRNDEWLGV